MHVCPAYVYTTVSKDNICISMVGVEQKVLEPFLSALALPKEANAVVVTVTREPLLMGKGQYHSPPCTDLFRPAHFILNILFTIERNS